MGSRPHDGFPTQLVIDGSAYVAPTAVVVGRVAIGANSSVWYGCVVRGDIEPITIGRDTNLQDGTIVHVESGGYETIIGDGVTIGHRAIIHGTRIEDGCLIGMGAIVLTGSRIGEEALVAAGSVVREGFTVPPRTLVAGIPARVVRTLDDAELARVREGSAHYVLYSRGYREGRLGGGPYGGTIDRR